MKKNRKIFIAAAVIVLIAAVVITATFSLNKSNYIETNDPDALYPYTVRNDKNRLTVTVQGSFPDEAFFHAATLTGATDVSEKKSTSKKAVFEIKAVSDGTDTVSIYLEKNGTFAERMYVITLYLIVENGGNITVTGSQSAALGDAVSKTDGDGICYVISSPGAGLCEISLMKRDSADSFVLKTDNPDLFRVLSRNEDEKAQTFRLSAKATGEANVTFLCDNQRSALSMRMLVNDALQFTADSFREFAHDAASEQFEKEKQQAEALVGTFILPDGVSVKEYNVLMSDGNGTFRTASVSFTEGEEMFSLFTSLSAQMSDFNDYFRFEEKAKAVKIGTLHASECPMENGHMILWTSSDNAKTNALQAPTRDDALSMVEKLIEADPSLR